ncbi:hypothetical protein KOR42_12510 [Thalassoglobus neptunius]|uniref:Thioredoxin domain-containing protein n=1 Tax=Thalassoglobus neptunius TaxID=1938619 RepID=A0A5C5X4I4_9PLAN|nr:hypothetical protein [Thalassoglobus neptunius]TWT57884.1 hypothetical protein KOR42_12510 [Thalassoglobus neptunius]
MHHSAFAQSLTLSCLGLFLLSGICRSEDPVFSGPQPGEPLPSLNMKGVLGEHSGKSFDVMEVAGNDPVLIFFVHERTRPAFGLMRAVMKYAKSRKEDGLVSAALFLTGDPTDTEKWMTGIQRYFPESVEFGLSPDGIEGPGAYGLNRNVSLTVLTGRDGKVTSNFALIQPSVQADGPKILKAIVDTIRSGEVPDIASLNGDGMANRSQRTMSNKDDPNMRPLLRDLIQRGATKADVDAAAKKVEDYVKEHPDARKQLGRIATTIVNSDRLPNYGTEAAQDWLKVWAKKFAPPETEQKQPNDSPENSRP